MAGNASRLPRRLRALSTLVLLSAAAGCGSPRVADPEPAAAEIAALRGRGAYASAARVADSVATRLDRSARASDLERADARRRAQLLHGYANLDSSSRIELSAADRLDRATDSLETAGEWNQAYALASLQLETRQRRLGPSHEDVATSLFHLGRLGQQRGSHATAVAQLERALSVRRALLGERHPGVAECLFHLAVAEKSAGRWMYSMEHHREALAIRRECFPADSPEIAESLNGLANIHRYLEQYPEALRLMRQGLAIRRRAFGEDDLAVADSRMDIGLVEIQMLRFSNAERELRRALAIRRRHLPPSHFELSVTANLLGIALTAQSKLPQAEETLRYAAAVAEQARQRAAPGPAKASRFRLTVYNELAAVLLARGRHPEAWREFERGQARELAEALIPGLRTAEFEPFSLERVQRALTSRTAIVGWLDIAPGVGEPHSAWGYVIRDQGPVHWIRLRPEGVTLGPVVTGHAPLLLELISSAAGWPVPVQETGSVRREGARLWAERVAPLLPHLAGASELIVVGSPSFHGAIDPMVSDDGAWLADRYAVAYAPSATLLTWWTEQRLASTATGPALLIGDPPFAARHLDEMRAEGNTRPGRLDPPSPAPPSIPAALANPVLRTDTLLRQLPRLTGSRWEIDRLRGLFPNATVLAGPEASEPALYRLARLGRLEQFGTIHIATHVLSRGAYDEWAIVLSQAESWAPLGTSPNSDPMVAPLQGESGSANSARDGLLTGPEIRDSLSLNCDLVTVSGCLSAGGATGYAAGALGVGNAFLYAGAHTILVSLWYADDRAIATFMTRFYENRAGAYTDDRGLGLGTPMRKMAALHEAKRWLREFRTQDGRRPYQHPAYWSGFLLIGDPG